MKPIELPRLDNRIPPWGGNLKDRSCPFCQGHGSAAYIRPDGLTANVCDHCGCFFIAPIPTPEVLSRFYRDYTRAHRVHPSLTKAYARRVLGSNPLSDFRVVEIASTIDLRGKQILDVGCGAGEDLVKFKKLGAIVEGVDFDEVATDFARSELGLENISNCSIEEFTTESTYEVILMNDLIEHLINPLEILLRVAGYLGENGLLVVYTPNASFIQRFNDTTALQVDLEHLQYLTFKTSNYLANRLNLELIHLESSNYANLGGLTGEGGSNRLLLRMKNYGSYLFSLLNKKDISRSGRYALFCMYVNSK